MEKRILSILVDNTSGVLSRVAGLFSRRGYNIDSITAGVTADQRYSRMTVVCEGDDQMLQQITKQLAKQEDVRDVKVLEQDDSVARELMLVKVAVKPEQRQGALSVADIFRAKVVDVSKDSLIMEMTGSQNKLQAFVELMADYEILELGAIAANTFGSATSSVFNPRLTRCRSTGFGTITAAVCSPARLKVFVGATQVMLFSLQVSDTEAKGT